MAREKTCTGCGEAKPLDAFSRHPRGRDGRHPRCKACKAARERERRREDPTYEREVARRYKARNPEKAREVARKTSRRQKVLQKERYPEKVAARKALENAIRRGAIQKPTVCEECDGEFLRREIHGHHHDYTKPLQVEWLCLRCHSDRHAADRRAGSENHAN